MKVTRKINKQHAANIYVNSTVPMPRPVKAYKGTEMFFFLILLFNMCAVHVSFLLKWHVLEIP